jgi:tetratricopeptide (TPR) repeat protein
MTQATHENDLTEWFSLVETGNAAYAERKYTEAELKFAGALRIAEKLAAPDTILGLDQAEQERIVDRLAKSLNNMAALYHTQGKYKMAEDLYNRCLDIKMKLHGEDHLEVALNLHNLAAVHSAKSRWAQAEPLYVRSLEIREKCLGKNHADLVPILNNYALMLHRAKRDAEAEQIENRAKEILNTQPAPQ